MKTILCLIAAGISSTLLAQQPSAGRIAPKSSWNITEHTPLSKFVIQSHRGAGVLAPENTIEAFELGWKLGTIPEADVRTTKDGVIVAFHDNDFKRVVKKATSELQGKGVADLTFAELSKLDVGAWAGDKFEGRRVSKMNEVFDLMRGHPERRVYLDFKNVDLKQLADDVNSHQISAQVILASRNPKIIRDWKKLVPESETLLWVPAPESNMRKTISEMKATDFQGITQVQIHVRLSDQKETGDPFVPSSAFLLEVGQELRSRKILFQTLPYTEEKGVYKMLLDLGVESFATDHPDVTWQEVKEYYASHGKPEAR
jgi:glycerophosphoryl diester phosphodiesterase